MHLTRAMTQIRTGSRASTIAGIGDSGIRRGLDFHCAPGHTYGGPGDYAAMEADRQQNGLLRRACGSVNGRRGY